MHDRLPPEQGPNRLFFGDRHIQKEVPQVDEIVLPEGFPMSRIVVPGEDGDPGAAFWVRHRATEESAPPEAIDQ